MVLGRSIDLQLPEMRFIMIKIAIECEVRYGKGYF
jgi:hypothetical protein